MALRNAALFALIAPALVISAAPVRAVPGISTISLTATRTTLLADGKHTTVLRAEVRDASGRPVGTNVIVQFQTTSGTLSQTQAQAIGGFAQVNLTSSPISGVANVTATVAGQSVATIEILFTDDPAATFEGNNYMLFAASGYMAYSATDRAIEANGRNGGARMTFRSFEINADRLQLKCDDQTLRAHGNVVLKRGKDVLHATVLYYSLATSQGYAIAQDENGNLKTVTVNGEHLRLEPTKTQIPYSYVNLPDFQIKLIIVAKGITYFPGYTTRRCLRICPFALMRKANSSPREHPHHGFKRILMRSVDVSIISSSNPKGRVPPWNYWMLGGRNYASSRSIFLRFTIS